MADTMFYQNVNCLTAFISLTTALYLLPLVPNLLGSLDKSLQDLVRLNDELTESKKQVVTFMAFLCHEIRNPLFAITSSITFLQDERMNDKQEQGIMMINQAANTMLRLVNDVLDIHKIESGMLEIEEHDFDLVSLLHGIEAASAVRTKQLHGDSVAWFSFRQANVPTMVRGDSVRLLQIIDNLLSNAIKFTDQGYVNFSVEVVDFDWAMNEGYIARYGYAEDVPSTDSTGNEMKHLVADSKVRRSPSTTVVLKIEVSDTGCGIDAVRLDRVFLPYSHAKLSEYRQHGGTGLGLAIVSKLTSALGGTINVSSQVNVGTSCVVYLPLQRTSSGISNSSCNTFLVATSNINPRSVDVETGIFRQRATCCGISLHGQRNVFENTPNRIYSEQMSSRLVSERTSSHSKFNFPSREAVVLIVDDNSLNLKMLGKMLDQFNVEHQEARDGLEAINIMKASRNVSGNPEDPLFSFVITDLSMPVMDGCQSIAIMRQELGLKIPIVALTANALQEGRDKALAVGATEFATKPILRDELHIKCRKFMLMETQTSQRLKDSTESTKNIY